MQPIFNIVSNRLGFTFAYAIRKAYFDQLYLTSFCWLTNDTRVRAVTAVVIRHCHYSAIGLCVGADAHAAQWHIQGRILFIGMQRQVTYMRVIFGNRCTHLIKLSST